MHYPLVCISTALHRRIILVVNANNYGDTLVIIKASYVEVLLGVTHNFVKPNR